MSKKSIKKYLHFVGQVKKMNAQHNLTRHEVMLLDLSARRYFLNESITVDELIHPTGLASSATLHCAFKALKGKKLLTTERRPEDAQVKQVLLTKLALEHFKNIDHVMSQPWQ